MPLEADVMPALPLVEPELLLLVAKTPLDAPPRKGDQEQRLDACLGRRVADEELHLAMIQSIASDDQMEFDPGQAVVVLHRDAGLLHVPDERALLAVSHVVARPVLITQCGRAFDEFLDAARRRTACAQPRRLAGPPSSAAAVRPLGDARTLGPTRKRHRNLGDEALATAVQTLQKQWFSAIAFVERQPLENDAVLPSAVVQFQGNLPLGAVDQLVGDARGATPLAILRPTFRQEQLAVDEAMEVAPRVAQVDRDDAILLLADGSAPLPLHARRLVPLLDVARLVDEPDRMGTLGIAADDFVQPTAQSVFIPTVLRQELLQGPRRDAGRQSHRLAALAGQFGELPLDVHGKVSPRISASKAVVKLVQITSQLRLQSANLIGVHALTSASKRTPATTTDSSISIMQATAT